MDPFWWKVIILVFVMVAQAALWAWVGLQARQKVPESWPIDVDIDVVNTPKR
jgi:hypothetical protein